MHIPATGDIKIKIILSSTETTINVVDIICSTTTSVGDWCTVVIITVENTYYTVLLPRLPDRLPEYHHSENLWACLRDIRRLHSG